MTSRPLLHEWMHRFHGAFGTIRVWTKSKGPSPQAIWEFGEQNRAIESVINTRLDDALADSEYSEYAELIAGLEFVTAVEHLDVFGNGRLVYVDWP